MVGFQVQLLLSKLRCRGSESRISHNAAEHITDEQGRLRIYTVEYSDSMRECLKNVHGVEAEEAFDCETLFEVTREATKAVQAFNAHKNRRGDGSNPKNLVEVIDKIGGQAFRRIEFLIELLPESNYKILAGGL